MHLLKAVALPDNVKKVEVIVLGNPSKSLALIEGLVARLEVLDFDDKAAIHAAEIRAELAKKGTPIGHYDVLIAGHARSCGLVLVSNNLREFERVSGLWLDVQGVKKSYPIFAKRLVKE